MKSSSCALLALVLALIIGGAYYFYSQKGQDKTSDQPLTSQEGISNNSPAENTGPVVLEPEKITLADVSGGEGEGIANRIFSSQKFIHTIAAQLKKAETGSYYAGWLIKQQGDKEEIISTGKLTQNGSDYYLEFRSDNDYSQYNKVVVSLQSKEDSQPKKTILEGEFK